MKAVHMVHDDYDNQLEVSWLCHECLKEIEDEVAAVESNLNPYVWGTQLIYRDKGRINNE
jgi:hypothetical protein